MFALTGVVGAHGVFESYGDYSNITAASFLSAPGKQTPVFVRFSTVAGSRGSADTARDVHGFATRFYTDEGNFGKTSLNILDKVITSNQFLMGRHRWQ
jgi:catalase